MKKLLRKVAIVVIILFILSNNVLAYDIAGPTFYDVDVFYTWALMDMRHTIERGNQETIDEYRAILGRYDRREQLSQRRLLRENSLQAVVRIEDMFPAISRDDMKVVRIEVNPYRWNSYRINFYNGISVSVNYDRERHREAEQYLPYWTRMRIDDMFISISLPSRANVPGRPDLDREAEAFYEEFFANDALRPLSDLFSLDDTVREAAEQVLAENVRENVIFFDGTYIPMDIWDSGGTSSSHLVLFVLIGTGVLLIGGAALWLLLWKRRGRGRE